jgi:hypothetical protein
MRHLALASVIFCFAACGDDAGGVDMAVPPDMTAIPPDMTKVPDMTMFDFKGISCGTQSCDGVTQECCLMIQNMAASGMCVAKGTCNKDAGASLNCDGPEDCTAGTAICCVTIGGEGDVDAGTLAGGSGQSRCLNACMASAAQNAGGGFDAQSKLCHFSNECTGYTGTIEFQGTQTLPFNRCCEVPQAPGFRFCAPGLVTMAGGICY